VTRGHAYTSIERKDGRRILNVTADVVPKTEAERILQEMESGPLADLKSKCSGLTYSKGGMQREITESMTSIYKGFALAVIAIFGMLAIVFRSYIQPIIIMVAIPFGIIGAVIGHIIMGFDLSIMSWLGVVALAGVVVNDSLVLIDFANVRRREGSVAFEAITSAGVQRFRPIILTTLTTFLGLTPMIMETSVQARMMVPMAISLGFGILFSTMITLLLIPSLYIIVEDIKSLFGLKTAPTGEISVPVATEQA
jgi:multidrug efflux pump subunit AcrB